jgi:hypothetical protein
MFVDDNPDDKLDFLVSSDILTRIYGLTVHQGLES